MKKSFELLDRICTDGEHKNKVLFYCVKEEINSEIHTSFVVGLVLGGIITFTFFCFALYLVSTIH